MKKLLALLLAAAFLCAATCAAGTDGVFHAAYALYDGIELFGEVEIPDGVFFIRATFLLEENQQAVLIVPISREGLFQAYIAVNCKMALIDIVDSPSAIVPGCGKLYLSAPVTLI